MQCVTSVTLAPAGLWTANYAERLVLPVIKDLTCCAMLVSLIFSHLTLNFSKLLPS